MSILYKEGYGRVRGLTTGDVLATQGARGGPDSRVAHIRASSHFPDGKSGHRSIETY